MKLSIVLLFCLALVTLTKLVECQAPSDGFPPVPQLTQQLNQIPQQVSQHSSQQIQPLPPPQSQPQQPQVVRQLGAIPGFGPSPTSNNQNNIVPIVGQQAPPPGAPVSASDEVCGLSLADSRHERIVGGRSASFGEVPFIVHLRESQLFRTLGYNKCGGVLINHRWALTAAHCQPAFYSSLEIILGKLRTFEDAPPPAGSAMASLYKHPNNDDSAGSSSSSHREMFNDIEHATNRRNVGGVLQVLADIVIVHPDYDPKSLEYDIALIKLKKPVPFREDIQPICLPNVDEDFTGLDAYATGWGLTHFEKRKLPETLQIVRLPIISNKRCQAMYNKSGHDKHITDNDLCAGYARGGMDACEGDSGGPLIVRRPNDHRWTLAGIVSNGVRCAEPLLPGVYTRVSKFVHWIKEKMIHHS